MPHWRTRSNCVTSLCERCLPWLLLCYAAPGLGQGSGPADFGWANYLVIAIWLAFWFGVVIYPLALVALLIFAFD